MTIKPLELILEKPILIEEWAEDLENIKIGMFFSTSARPPSMHNQFPKKCSEPGCKHEIHEEPYAQLLDFIFPLYHPSLRQQQMALVANDHQAIHKDNPLLAICFGINPLPLSYKGVARGESLCSFTQEYSEYEKLKEVNVYKVQGRLRYSFGAFANDANQKVFDVYRKSLQQGGFLIRP